MGFLEGGRHAKRIVFVLACHNFPPLVKQGGESTEGKDCLKVIRVEGGGLAELVAAMKTALGGARVPLGTIVLLGSLAELGRVGLEAYAAQLHSQLYEHSKKQFRQRGRGGALPPDAAGGHRLRQPN